MAGTAPRPTSEAPVEPSLLVRVGAVVFLRVGETVALPLLVTRACEGIVSGTVFTNGGEEGGEVWFAQNRFWRLSHSEWMMFVKDIPYGAGIGAWQWLEHQE